MVLVPPVAPGVQVINGYAVFICAAELPCYRSGVPNCRAPLVSLFNTQNKSLSSKQAVPAACVFLETFISPSNRKTQTRFYLLQRKLQTNLCFLFLLSSPLLLHWVSLLCSSQSRVHFGEMRLSHSTNECHHHREMQNPGQVLPFSTFGLIKPV